MNPIGLNSFRIKKICTKRFAFRIKSRSARMHPRKIWLLGQIFYRPRPWRM